MTTRTIGTARTGRASASAEARVAPAVVLAGWMAAAAALAVQTAAPEMVARYAL